MPTMQRHVIKRQIIELSIPDQAGAQQLQSEVSRIYRQRLAPLLDQLCSELCAPDQLYRIDRLEVDLAQINSDQLERELVQRARQALRQALAREINRQAQQQHPPTGSQLELLAFFLRTGSLPWWVDAGQPHPLHDALKHLIETAPDALRRLLHEVSRSAAQLRRLVQTFADETLGQLAAVLAPTLTGGRATDLMAFINLLAQTRRVPVHLLKPQAWLALLELLTRSPELAARPAKLYAAVLTQLATHFAIPYAALLADLEQAWPAAAPPKTLQTAIHELLTPAAVSPSLPLAGQIAALRARADRLPEPLRRQLLAELDQLAQPAITGNSRQQALRRIAAQLRASLKPPFSIDKQALLAELAAWEDISTESMSAAETADLLTHRQQPAPPPESADLSFSQADEIYIHNAGLVILWPFLPRFFENLGLLSERRFKDEAAQHRAAGILQYLVHPEAEFPEYLLPLNKVLCGLDLASVFSFGPALTESEIDHCAALLEAVIAQAPILRQMSVDGFRGTFLLRAGSLSRRDDAWLLRVERASYDVVLDRFPWSWQWLKLPWMDAPLRVEW